MLGQDQLTVDNNKQVDAKDGKTFSYFVVRVLELSLHHRCIYLDNNYAAQAGQYHSIASQFTSILGHIDIISLLSSTPLVGQEQCREDVGSEGDGPINACQSKNGF